MKPLIALGCAVLLTGMASAQRIKVTNAAELIKANETARPGDTIILQNGKWNDVPIHLNCSGTADKPILFRAETPGKVIVCGVSELKLDGSYIIADHISARFNRDHFGFSITVFKKIIGHLGIGIEQGMLRQANAHDLSAIRGERNPGTEIIMIDGMKILPAERYVQVTDAVVMNNNFVDCSLMSLCEGSDEERTLPPSHVLFAKNAFFVGHDTALYKAWDDISGILFTDNEKLPVNSSKTIDILPTRKASGAKWYVPGHYNKVAREISCANAAEIYQVLEKQSAPLLIHLTGQSYTFDKPVVIANRVTFTGKAITLHSTKDLPALFIVKGKGYLRLDRLQLSGAHLSAASLIDTDSSGTPEHYNVIMNQVVLSDFNTLLNARESSLADSIVVQQCRFDHIKNGFMLAAEKTDKGYYNVEKIRFTGNQFTNGKGMLLDLYRGGKDESTLGPQLVFANNHITNYNTSNQEPLVQLTGVQISSVTGNQFSQCNANKPLIVYKDFVRAIHYLSRNNFTDCGTVAKNNFVKSE